MERKGAGKNLKDQRFQTSKSQKDGGNLKRIKGQESQEGSSRKRPDLDEEEVMMMEEEANDTAKYEDEFEDEYEDEELEDDEWESADDDYEEITAPTGKKLLVNKKKIESEISQKKPLPDVVPFLGNEKHISKDEYLDFENGAYKMLHRANTEWPCLSCDFISGEIGLNSNPNLQIEKNP